MSPISPVSTNQVTTPPNARSVDADGDHDGSKPGEVESKKTQAPAPVPPKPTETLGNNVNTYA